MNAKLLFILLSMRWGLIKEQTTSFKNLVRKTLGRTMGPSFFKLYKKKVWSENHETCRDVLISYGKTVIKIWKGFVKVCRVRCLNLVGLHIKSWNCFGDGSVCMDCMLQLSRNLFKFLSQHHHMISWHVNNFHDFLSTFAFYTI